MHEIELVVPLNQCCCRTVVGIRCKDGVVLVSATLLEMEPLLLCVVVLAKACNTHDSCAGRGEANHLENVGKRLQQEDVCSGPARWRGEFIF